MRILTTAALALGLLGFAVPALPQDKPRQPAEQKPASTSVLDLLPADAKTEHVLKQNGATIAYTATAGTLNLYAQNGERNAAVFYVAYVRKDADTRRPLTFVFNGGPGAASAYLHLGLVGPKIAQFGANGRDGGAATLRDNPESWLAFTDLVLVDPVGTGWSRTVKTDDAKSFYNVQSDAQALAKVIALYVAQNGRTASPKFILGESYGGFRALKVARAAQDTQGIVISGIVALSPLLEGALTFSASRFALGAALQLPSLAAAELQRRGRFSKDALAEAERFAMTEYLTTLAGPPPQGDKAKAFYARVAQLTGLPADEVAKRRGFIRDSYVKNLRTDAGEVVSPYDAAFAVPDPFPESPSARNADPVLDGFTRALSGLFVGYANEDLRFKTPITYVLLASDIASRWDWHRADASVSNDIRELLALNPSFRMVIAHGYADLVTPYAASRYVIDHLPPIGGAGRVTLKLYPGGHMFYFDPQSRAAFYGDIAAFYSGFSE